jgi:large subunit ribosomal protein L15
LRDIIKKLPKRRGYGKNRARTVHSGRVRPIVVNIGILSNASLPAAIDPRSLVTSGLIRRQAGRIPPVKILGAGNIDKKLSISGCLVSAAAREKVERAGGTVS